MRVPIPSESVGSAMMLASHRFLRWLGPPDGLRTRFQSVHPTAQKRKSSRMLRAKGEA